MLMMLRHALAILLLPFLVVVVVPYWILTTLTADAFGWADSTFIVWLARSAGALLFLAGFALFSWTVTLFARVGKGTLAPWDPTRELVIVGPYRLYKANVPRWIPRPRPWLSPWSGK